MHADERETDVTDVAATESSQVATAARRIDEDVTGTEALLLSSLEEMIYHFLEHAIDMKGSNLIDKLAAKDILSPDERQKIKELKKVDAKVKSLLMMLREKSAAQFESFLRTLSETGQQSVANSVLQALLQYSHGMPAFYFSRSFSTQSVWSAVGMIMSSVCLSVTVQCALWLNDRPTFYFAETRC